jgi:hypothetical protein
MITETHWVPKAATYSCNSHLKSQVPDDQFGHFNSGRTIISCDSESSEIVGTREFLDAWVLTVSEGRYLVVSKYLEFRILFGFLVCYKVHT